MFDLSFAIPAFGYAIATWAIVGIFDETKFFAWILSIAMYLLTYCIQKNLDDKKNGKF